VAIIFPFISVSKALFAIFMLFLSIGPFSFFLLFFFPVFSVCTLSFFLAKA